MTYKPGADSIEETIISAIFFQELNLFIKHSSKRMLIGIINEKKNL